MIEEEVKDGSDSMDAELPEWIKKLKNSISRETSQTSKKSTPKFVQALHEARVS